MQSSFKDPIYTGPNQIDVSSIAPGFNELFYLRNNPDVKSLVDQGVYQTGLHHYLDLGLSEERAIFAPHSIVKSGDEGWDLVLTSGNEVGIGGAGDDILYGYDGDDTLTGGAGSDVFRFEAGDNGSDIITDFTCEICNYVRAIISCFEPEYIRSSPTSECVITIISIKDIVPCSTDANLISRRQDKIPALIA